MTKFLSILCGVGLMLAFQKNATAQIITNSPQSITINNASTATFSVGASNALTYQWQFNDADIDGATNSTLTLEDVMTNQAGSYTVVVGSTTGSVTSSPPAILTVVPGTIVQFILSGLPEGMASNVNVQFFDHDKPATVENFIHYIKAGGFTNMFFDRCSAEFVLQGGDDGASNRTSTSPPLTGWDIASQFTDAANQPTLPYPHQVDNEFGVGPLIHNRFGTIAMALSSSTTNSANSAFFFNTVDNTSELDDQDFTVFGRILDANGTNVLQYFNSLTTGNGVVSPASFLDDGVLITVPALDFLPVNYLGTNAPANSNLVFCDFAFVTSPPVDTNPPVAMITIPTPNAVFTNALQGTASDDVGLAVIFCVLTPQYTGGMFPYPYQTGASVTNYATGTTNWSLSLYPGVYNVSVRAQDGAGNLSATNSQFVTNTAIVTNGIGTVSFTQGAPTNANPVGYPMQYGSNYFVKATPGSNQTFVNWSDGSDATTNEVTSFYYYTGLVYTATFISNVVGGIAFTFPTNDAVLSNTLFNITGTVSNSVLTLPVTITGQVFTNGVTNAAVTLPESVVVGVGATNWSLPVTNYLPTGSYTIQALATDQHSNQTVISEDFSFVADTNLPSVAITSPASGAVFYENSPMIVQGTASDNFVPVASVNLNMIPLAEPDGVSPNNGFSFGNSADGTTNWSMDLVAVLGPDFSGSIPPGRYNLQAQAQDAAGNVANQTQPLTISALQINGVGTIDLTEGTNAKANPVGYPLQSGTTYDWQAKPGPGETFGSWKYNDYIVVTNPMINFQYSGGLLTATFVPTNRPKGTKGISFTYPTANAKIRTNSFLLKGNIAKSFGPAQITCQITSLSSQLGIGSPLTTSGTTNWSIAVTNLAPGSYVVQAVATNTNYSTIITEDFSVLGFKDVVGTYTGLFLCDTGPVAPTNSGFFSLTVTGSGSYTGNVISPAYGTIPIIGSFNAEGTIGQAYYTFKFPKNTTYLYGFTLDLTNGTDELTGTVAAEDSSWSSSILCHRAVTDLSSETTPAIGKYILALVPTNSPITNGYASVSIGSGGSLTFGGALPDGASFSRTARVATNGVWPFYAVPYASGKKGMLIGWETNLASGNSTGQIYWYKAPNVGSYYTSGVQTNINSTGTNYVAPAPGPYSIVFHEDTNSAPITNGLTLAVGAAQFTINPPAPSDKLSLSLSAKGVLTGHFIGTNDTKAVQFKGAFFGQSQGGSGVILDGDGQTGWFELEAVPQ